MNLLIDIGNTRSKWAVAEGETLTAAGWIDRADGDAWPQALPEQRPEAVWVANVAGPAPLRELTNWCRQHWALEPRLARTTAAACGLVCGYPAPQHLGVDRWLACIGGFHDAPAGGSVLVVDAGTALTLDYVAADGRHHGGLIAPGVASMRGAIRGGTQIRTQVRDEALHWLATDTDAAVGLGTLRAALALIENARAELAPARTLLTGGEAPQLMRYLPAECKHLPQLVLAGLARVAADAGR